MSLLLSNKLAKHFCAEDPASPYNMLPEFMQYFCSVIDVSYLKLSYEELGQHLFGSVNEAQPGSWQSRLRHSLWDEINAVQVADEKLIRLDRVMMGIVRVSDLRRLLEKRPEFMIWLLTPPISYMVRVKEIAEEALKRQLEAVSLPIKDEKGRPNVKLIEAQMKIFQHLDFRIRGDIVRKVEQKNLNVNVDGGKALPPAAPKSLAEVDAEIEKLRKLSESLRSPGQVKLDEKKLITGEIIAETKPAPPSREINLTEVAIEADYREAAATEASYSSDESTSGDV